MVSRRLDKLSAGNALLKGSKNVFNYQDNSNTFFFKIK
jgi:hypothetical protein